MANYEIDAATGTISEGASSTAEIVRENLPAVRAAWLIEQVKYFGEVSVSRNEDGSVNVRIIISLSDESWLNALLLSWGF